MAKKLISLIGMTILLFAVFGGLPREGGIGPPVAKAAYGDTLYTVDLDTLSKWMYRLEQAILAGNTAIGVAKDTLANLATAARTAAINIAANTTAIDVLKDTTANLATAARTSATNIAANTTAIDVLKDTTQARLAQVVTGQGTLNTTVLATNTAIGVLKDTTADVATAARTINTTLGLTNTAIGLSTTQLTTVNTHLTSMDSSAKVTEEQIVVLDEVDYSYQTFTVAARAAGGAALACSSNATVDTTKVMRFRDPASWATYNPATEHKHAWPMRQQVYITYQNCAGTPADTDSANVYLALMVSDSAGGPFVEAGRVYIRGAAWASNAPKSHPIQTVVAPGANALPQYVYTPPYKYAYWYLAGASANNGVVGIRSIRRVGMVSLGN